MVKLLDQYGVPVTLSALTTEISGPDMVGQRPAVVSTPILGLDPVLLGSAMSAASAGDSLAWMTIAEAIEERDAHYQGVLGKRRRQVAQLPITVDPASDDPNHKKQAEFVEKWLRDGLLERCLFDVLDAIGKGWSVHELDWALAPGNNRVVGLKYRPQRWFEVSYQDGETILMRDINTSAQPSVPGGPPQASLTALPQRKFLVHRHPSWSGTTLCSGLTRTVGWHSMLKAFSSRDWGLFVQAYGLPLRIGKYGPGASDNDKAVLARAVFDLAGAAGVLISDKTVLEFVEPKHGAGSNDIHQRRCDWLDSQTSKVVLGQTSTTDAKQGSHAVGKIHRDVEEDIERADSGLVSWTINEQLIRPMIAFTFGEQAGGYPRVRIGRPDEASVEEITSAIQWLGPQGLKVRATEVRQRLNFSEPEPDDTDDDLIGGRTPTPPPPTAPHDLPAEVRPAQNLPGHVAPPTVQDENAAPKDEQAATTTLHSQLGRVLIRHARDNGPGLVTALSQSAARDCADGFAALCRPAQEAYEQATSLEDFRARLHAMNLPQDELADAMANAMLVAELAGEAMILEQIRADG